MALRDRLTTIRDLAENVLERVETRWDQAMDVLHGRPIRDPYLEDPRQLPQPPRQPPPLPQIDPVQTIGEGEWQERDAHAKAKLMLGQSGEGYHYHVTTNFGGADTISSHPYWSEKFDTKDLAEEAGQRALVDRIHPEMAAGAEHEPTAEELAQNEEYEQARWPDLEEEPEPDYGFEMIYESEWTVPEPGVETQLLLAQSNDGYHYAVYTSVRGGDPGDPGWSKAYETREMADEAGHAALIERHYPYLAGMESAEGQQEDLLSKVEAMLAGMGNDESFYQLDRSAGGYAAIQVEQMSSDEVEVYGAPSRIKIAEGKDLNELHENLVAHQDRSTHAVTEVRARDWWEDQRAQILDALLSVHTKREKLEALGPEPADDAKVWLNGQGQRVEQPSVELQPIEIERPAIEERADRDEHALGLEREDEHSQEHAELEL